MNPVVYIPWPSALAYADDVLPCIIEIARTGVPFLHLPYGFTDRMRNEAVKHFLQSNYDVLVMLDADHRHPPDVVKRLVADLETHDEIDIVGALNFKRCQPYDPCAYVDVDGKAYCLNDWDQGLIEVDAVGTGAVAIRRRVFETLTFPWFVNQPNFEAQILGSHDIYFCRQAASAGFTVYVDTTLTSPHLASHSVAEQSFRSWQQVHPVPADQLYTLEEA